MMKVWFCIFSILVAMMNACFERTPFTSCFEAAVSHLLIYYANDDTVKPRFNEPRYNEDPVLTNNI